jgi:hypothetical protein
MSRLQYILCPEDGDDGYDNLPHSMILYDLEPWDRRNRDQAGGRPSTQEDADGYASSSEHEYGRLAMVM